MTRSMDAPQDRKLAEQTPPQQTLNEHRRTYDRMLGMFKYLILFVAFVLLVLVIFFR